MSHQSFEQLAQTAFKAHVKEMDHQGAFAGAHRKPTWDDLGPEFKQGWVAAAKQLWAEFAAIH